MDSLDVRRALVEDEEGVMELCRNLHQENGLFDMDEPLVRSMLHRAFDRRDGILGVIGPPGGPLEASIYLLISRFWYSYRKHLEELWTFVHPDHRRTPHAKSLINFAKTCSDELQIPLNIGILSNERTEAKVRLYERQIGKPAGAFFFYNAQFAGGPAATLSGT